LVFETGPSLGFLSVQVEILILFILSIVFLIAARLMLARMEKLAIQEGRLTENRR
jgi:membrane protein implicated in regulation of membrane protease activity